MGATRYRIFVAVTPGLEQLLEQELGELEIGLLGAARERGGIEFSGDRECLWRVACCSRLAESIRVRIGKPFVARSFEQLQQVTRLPWAAFLNRSGPGPRVKVTCHRSRLHHSGAVAERIAEAVAGRLGLNTAEVQEMTGPTIFARLVRDRVQLSVDASGELLHRRGYRIDPGRAPLRETLAAACVRAAGYVSRGGGAPLWDPFCGTGTILLEALGAITGKWPGVRRTFAFERWPAHDAGAFEAFKAGLERRDQTSGDVIVSMIGSDLDQRQLDAAARNARRADLERQVAWHAGDFEEVEPEIPEGAWIVTNPPYGPRYRGKDLGELYRRFGELLRRRPDLAARTFVLSGHPAFRARTKTGWQTLLSFHNQGVPVELLECAPKWNREA
jgi:putative N6-adenine-specific DNA methylase